MSIERQREIFQGICEEDRQSVLQTHPADRISGVVDETISHTLVSLWPEIAKTHLRISLLDTLMHVYETCEGKWRSIGTFSQGGKLHLSFNDNSPFAVVSLPFKPKDYAISPQHAPQALRAVFNDALEMLQGGVTTYEELQNRRNTKPGSLNPGRDRHTNGPARAGSDNNSR